MFGAVKAIGNWNSGEKLETGEEVEEWRSFQPFSMPVTTKITNVYGQYQQMKARIRENQLSSVGKLWTEDDFHCMKMNI